MSLNHIIMSEARWRQLPTALLAMLRRRLGRKVAIVNHQVLEVARAFCTAGA
jgi:hypothetical protein